MVFILEWAITRVQVLIGGNFALANEDFTQMNYGKVSVIYRFLPLKEKSYFLSIFSNRNKMAFIFDIPKNANLKTRNI